MIKKIVFCLILLCCMSSVAFAGNSSDKWHVDGADWCATEIYGNIEPAPFVDYTDTYTVDHESGKFIPLGEVTKPLPENMVMYNNQGISHTGWGLTYEDIMNHNTQIHPLK